MTKFVRWYYLASVLTVLLLFIGAGIVFWSFTASALVLPGPNINNITGWAWSGNTGWISLNSKYCEDLSGGANPCTVSGGEYGLRLIVDADGTGGEIFGYAWSENLGWICFGDTCTDMKPTEIPVKAVTFTCEDTGNPVTCDQVTTASVTGAAQIISLGSEGWISLDDIDATDDYGVSVEFGDGETSSRLRGFMWQYAGGANLAQAYGLGWICFGDDTRCTFDNPEILFPYLQVEGGDIFARRISTGFPPPQGEYNAKYLIHVFETDQTSISTRFTTQCGIGSTLYEKEIMLCLSRDYRLEVPEHDPSSPNPFNFKLGRFDFAGLARPEGNLIPIDQIINTTNIYGFPLLRGDNTIFPVGNFVLGNRVIVIEGDLTVGNLTFNNGENAAGTIIVGGDLIINGNIEYQSSFGVEREQLASVAWIVLGDVKIDPDVEKVAGSFIVLGERPPAVKNLKCSIGGAICTRFGATCNITGVCRAMPLTVEACRSPSGNSSKERYTCDSDADCDTINTNAVCSVDHTNVDSIFKCNAFDKDNDGDIFPGCGWFDVGEGSDHPIIVNGSVFARQFKLGRSYIDIVSRGPAEKFIADGRIQLNPPPGLSDFAKGLPSFRRQ
ncbi:MAG: hypothetical protein ABIJ81_01075 [Patescibacteria group bacterium]